MSDSSLYDKLHEYVQKWWEEIEPDVAFAHEVDEFPIPEDHKEAVELYFDYHGNENLSIDEMEVL
jgi:hypothetical protein